jgi:hypothetical protein
MYLLVVDVSSQVAGPGTILGAEALTYHKILIYNTILTCPKQLKSHIGHGHQNVWQVKCITMQACTQLHKHAALPSCIKKRDPGFRLCL